MKPSRHAMRHATQVREAERQRTRQALLGEFPSDAQFRELLRAIAPERSRPRTLHSIADDLVARTGAGERLGNKALAPFREAFELAWQDDLASLIRFPAYQWARRQKAIDIGFRKMQRRSPYAAMPYPALPAASDVELMSGLDSLLKPPTRRAVMGDLMPEEREALAESGELEQHIRREQSPAACAGRLERHLRWVIDRHPAESLAPLLRAYLVFLYVRKPDRLRHAERQYQQISKAWLGLAEDMERAAANTFESTADLSSMLMDEARRLRRHHKPFAQVLAALGPVFAPVRRDDAGDEARVLIKDLHDGLHALGWQPAGSSLRAFMRPVMPTGVPVNSWFQTQLKRLQHPESPEAAPAKRSRKGQ